MANIFPTGPSGNPIADAVKKGDQLYHDGHWLTVDGVRYDVANHQFRLRIHYTAGTGGIIFADSTPLALEKWVIKSREIDRAEKLKEAAPAKRGTAPQMAPLDWLTYINTFERMIISDDYTKAPSLRMVRPATDKDDRERVCITLVKVAIPHEAMAVVKVPEIVKWRAGLMAPFANPVDRHQLALRAYRAFRKERENGRV